MRVLLLALPLLLSAGAATPEERAIQYLSAEVPRWFQENHCYSCHNNGDAARALYTAAGKGYSVAPEGLADTTRFLAAPAKWNENQRGVPAAGDNKLARIQFTAALAAAVDAGVVKDRGALAAAARAVALYQSADGSFPFDDPGSSVGSPVTYGTPLATVVVLRVLEASGDPRDAERIRNAEAWLERLTPKSNLDRAAILMARPSARTHIEALMKAQGSEGGWGPQPNAPAEVFDTAAALLGLAGVERTPAVSAALAAVRGYLIKTQLPAGGWVATTRPTGAQSYAQHISTTGWAAMALISTNPKP